MFSVLNFCKIQRSIPILYHNLLPMCLMRYLLSMSFLLVCVNANSQKLDLDFVPYQQLTDTQKDGVSEACSGKFVDGFNDYTKTAKQGSQTSISKQQRHNDQNWILDGNVQIIQQSLVMLSDSVEYNNSTGKSTLSGNTQLRFDGLMLQGETAKMDLNTHTGVIKNAKFIIHKSNINGTADEIRRDNDGIFHLKGFTISRCNPDQRSWWLKGRSLTINPNNGMITSVNNWLWVAGIPVFYTPYIHMPYDDHATSGLLVPTFAFSKGLKFAEFNQPLYFRIKPNLDLTTTLSYLTQNRIELGDGIESEGDDNAKVLDGLFINNELRFLSNKQQGTFNAAYSSMPSQTFGDNLKTVDRYHLNFKQKWDLNWFTSDIDLNALSDEYFFPDFYDKSAVTSANQSIKNVYKIEDTVINQTLTANWALEHSYSQKLHFLKHELNTKEHRWDLYFKQHWQEVDARKATGLNGIEFNDFTFQLAPAFEANYQSTDTTQLKFDQDIKFEVANFDKQIPDSLLIDGELTQQLRLAFKGTYSLPYQFQIGQTDATYKVKPSVRLQLAIYPGFIPEDDSLNNGYINALNTIEQNLIIPTAINDQDQIVWQPELIWQYVPLVDSSYLPILDSANSSSGYGNSTRFSGLDRLGDTKEIHYSFAMKYQKNKKDYASVRFEQRYLYQKERLNLTSLAEKEAPMSEGEEEIERFSNYGVQASLNPNDYTALSGKWEYSPDWKIKSGEFSLNYHLPNNQYVRFTSFTGYGLIEADKLEGSEVLLNTHLLSLSGQIAINHQVGLIGYGHWKYDVTSEQSTDYVLGEIAFGVEYDDCCWSVRMLSYNNFLDEENADNKIHFQIAFKGLGQLDQGFESVTKKYLPAYPGSLFEQD